MGQKYKILFATGNEGKMREVRMILQELTDAGVEIMSLKDAGIAVDIDENGATFAENAEIKVRALYEHGVADVVLADDSGLVIDYLNGEPGIYSARYLGEDTSYEIKNRVLIERMEGAEGAARSARFVCAIAACFPGGVVEITEGTMEGRIAQEPAGCGGFGYDPILFLSEYGKTSAELSAEEKNEVSHRGKALRAMKERLKRYYA